MPDDLTPGAGPFPATPGIAPSPIPRGGIHYPPALAWFGRLMAFITDPFGTAKQPGGGLPGAMAPTAAPRGEKIVQALTPSPGTQEAIKSGAILPDVTKLPSKLGNTIADRLGLPSGGVNWQGVGVYLALFVLLAIGVTSLLQAAKER